MAQSFHNIDRVRAASGTPGRYIGYGRQSVYRVVRTSYPRRAWVAVAVTGPASDAGTPLFQTAYCTTARTLGDLSRWLEL